MELSIIPMQISSLSCHFLRLRSKYCSQHPVLTHPQPIFLLESDKISHMYKAVKLLFFIL
jgi:hypothetical protein